MGLVSPKVLRSIYMLADVVELCMVRTPIQIMRGQMHSAWICVGNRQVCQAVSELQADRTP